VQRCHLGGATERVALIRISIGGTVPVLPRVNYSIAYTSLHIVATKRAVSQLNASIHSERVAWYLVAPFSDGQIGILHHP
jgi:hypothetical protein